MSTNSASSKKYLPMANKYDRVVLLVDMDCFYCQVEEKLNPSLKGKPLAVVQYNAWKGGGIIAVNYAARAKGVTRHMRGDEAKIQCPEIQLIAVPSIREKADLTKYRDAGKDVALVLQRFTTVLQRASVDEAYLDITDVVNKRFAAMNDGSFILKPQELIGTYAVGFPSIGNFVTTITNDFLFPSPEETMYNKFPEEEIQTLRRSNIKLLVAASIASEIRAAVYKETGYECSAGISLNKMLAKLACGLNKPNKQTILPITHIHQLFATLPLSKIQGLGAKFGEEVCQQLGIRYVGEIQKFKEAELQRKFDEKNGTWLYNICRGIDLEIITPRFYAKSIGCCKKFPGRNCISGVKTLNHWLMELANEISDRLKEDIVQNNRLAKHMVLNFVQEINNEDISSSRSSPLKSYEADIIAGTCMELIKTNTKVFFRPGSNGALNNPIKFLGINAGKFETLSSKSGTIQAMFAQQAAKRQKINDVTQPENNQNESTTLTKNESKNHQVENEGQYKHEPVNQNEKIKNELENGRKPVFKNTIQKMFAQQPAKQKVNDECYNSAVLETKQKKMPIESQGLNKDIIISNDIQNKSSGYEENAQDDSIPSDIFIKPKQKGDENKLTNCISSQKQVISKQQQEDHDARNDDRNTNVNIEPIPKGSIKHLLSQHSVNKKPENACMEVNSETKNIGVQHVTDKVPISEIAEIFVDSTNGKKTENVGIVTNEKHSLDYESSNNTKMQIFEELVTCQEDIMLNNSYPNESVGENTKVLNNKLLTKGSTFVGLNNENNKSPSNSTVEVEDGIKANDNCELDMLLQDLETFQSETENITNSIRPNKKRKFDEIIDQSDTKDYRSEYVEYALPVCNTELELYTKCSKCGANIYNDPVAIQTHHDHHFAHEISQQQRNEFREHFRMKFNSAKSPDNDSKIKTKKLPTKNMNKKTISSDITKFLKPSASLISNETLIKESSENFGEICSICNARIKPDDMAEHKDFHLAKELQKELNKLDAHKVDVIKPISGINRKSLNASSNARKPNVITKPITTFFTQPNM
ncbi:DNA polymerase eta [Musca autumnalis]|uniref:DNA polymerase eta n=1 Tax=Musca autumnalis TaxID=221902 RepID=UPI003CF03DFF